MKKWWIPIIGTSGLFGPLFMTNIAGAGRGGDTMLLVGVAMVAGVLTWVLKTLERQAAEIDRLKQIVGARATVAPTGPTA